MKARPFKGTPVPSVAGRSPLDTLTRREAVALLASRVPRAKHDDDKTVRNAISTNIYDAVKVGKLHEVKTGRFRLGDVGLWARAKWPTGQFSDVPMSPISGSASGVLPALRGTSAGYMHATTLEAAVGEILGLRADNVALAEALAVATGRVRELEPIAEKYLKWIEKKKGKRRS